MRNILPLLWLFFWGLTDSANAVIIRHDVDVKQYEQLAKEKRFDCVGYFKKKGEAGGGSCVLVSPKYILTAAHCFIESDTRPVKTKIGDKEVTVYQPYNNRIIDINKFDFFFKGKKYKASKLTLHPLYFVDSLENTTYDIAIVELKDSITGISFPKINTLQNEKGDTGIFVAYGTSGLGDNIGSIKRTIQKLAGENVIDSIGGNKYRNVATKLIADFDGNNAVYNKIGSPTSLQLEFGCSGGDSGGPLFIEKEDQLLVAGILSGGGFTDEMIKGNIMYGQFIKWTRISVFSKWIDTIIH